MPNPLTTTDKEATRVKLRDGRHYVWQGERYPSVTTILSNGVPKPFLVNWAKKVTAEYAVENIDLLTQLIGTDEKGAIDWLKGAAYRQRDEAAEIGSMLHDFAEDISMGKQVELPEGINPSVEKMGRNFLDFMETVDPTFTAVEAVVFNTKEGYAGTLDSLIVTSYEPILDALGWSEDRPMTLMCDIKTGKGVYPEVGLQLAAYANAEFVGLSDGSTVEMPPVDGAVVLHVRPQRWQLVPVSIGQEVYEAFLVAKAVSEWTTGGKDNVLGNPLMTGRA